MNIIFKNVKWKNFLSYGENYNTYDFENGIDLVLGLNGEGKSVIADVIFYSLFGKPFRKIKANSLINRIQKKKLSVEILFNVNKNEYKIIRGMKPAVFEIYKKSKNKFVLIEQKAASKDYQKMLENEILMINEIIFRQLIILGANLPSSKPFMELSKQEKESLFQVITDTSIFNIINDNIKDKISVLKSDIKDKTYKRELLESHISSEENMIKQAEERNKNFENNHKENIDITNSNIKTTQEKIEKYTEGLIKLKKIKDEYDIIKIEENALKNNLTLFNDQLQNIKNELSKIDSAEKGAIICNDCGTKNYLIDVDVSKKNHFINNKEKIEKNILQYNNLYNEIKTTSDKMKEKLLNGKRIKETLNELKNDLKYYENSLIELNNIKLEKINYSILNENKKELEKITVIMKKDNILLDKYISLSSIIGADNLKGSIIKQQIPFLNKGINYFLELFSIVDYSFIIDEHFKERIISKNEDSEFNQLSNGQKARISFSLMFAFLKLIEKRNGVKTNLLILDEILDSSVDSRGREELLNILKEEFSSSKNIIIISHNSEIKEKIELFNRIVNITKKTYSSLNIDEI